MKGNTMRGTDFVSELEAAIDIDLDAGAGATMKFGRRAHRLLNCAIQERNRQHEADVANVTLMIYILRP